MNIRTLTALALLLALAAIPAAAAPQERAAGPVIEAASTGANSELRKTVPITRRRGDGERIVLSMGPGRLAGINRGDRLDLSSEIQVTVDCTVSELRCAGRPYRFDPTVIVRLELASKRNLKARSRTIARRKISCGQQEPLRQHHCPVVFDHALRRVGEDFPCRLQRCFVNLVVSAHSHKARGGERVIIGANKPSGRIVQNKGRLNAVRLGPGVRTETLRKKGVARRSLLLRPRQKVILSRRVNGLERGEVLAVGARLRSDVRHLGYSALVGGELVAARGPRAKSPSRLIRRSVSQRGQISPINGTNCTPALSPCLTHKVGVLEIRRPIRGRSGRATPLFVNFVVRTKQKRVAHERGARLRLRSGNLVVRRYFAP